MLSISKENLNYAIRNLLNRKIRTSLTVLSILVGIATIFIFISFGFGLYTYIDEISLTLGVDKLVVQTRGIGAPGLDSTFKLLDKDLDALRKTRGISVATGMPFSSAQITSQGKLVYQFLVGLPVDDKEENELALGFLSVGVLEGRQLQKGDRGRVFLGQSYSVDGRIFDKALKIGDKIEINGKDLKIVGFLEEIGNPSDDSNIYITFDEYLALEGSDELNYAMLVGKVDNVDEIDTIKERATRNLRKSRGQKEGKEDFFISSYQELIASFSGALNIVVGFIILIALVSVVVSAVNTANTMFTSILERTKEIGVLKAIGARNSEIMTIFLIESGIQGTIAGVLGVCVGALLSYIGGEILASLGWSFLKPVFPLVLFIGLILFATVVGVISGILPAYNASKKNPVDSLRYE
jgi:putative ABC transport system permease protein